MADIITLFPNRSDEEHPHGRINAAVAELRRLVPGWLQEMEAAVAAPFGPFSACERALALELRRSYQNEVHRLRVLLNAVSLDDPFSWIHDRAVASRG